MDKEEFVKIILQQQKLNSIKRKKEEERVLRGYSCESYHMNKRGKTSDFKIRKSGNAH